MLDGQEVYVGSPGLFASLGVQTDDARGSIEDFTRQARTVVLVGRRSGLIGLLALRDRPRPEARAALAALRRLGISAVVMLTGDNARTAAAVASELGIDDYKAELRPEAKVAAIRELQQAYGKVAMVGDGINDAPVLATANVGIAMGTAGTDAAIEAADIALMGDDLRGVVYAMRLGRQTQRVMRQNIAFSIALLAVLVPSAIAGFLTVAIAVTAHEVAELIAVLNGLRARVPSGEMHRS